MLGQRFTGVLPGNMVRQWTVAAPGTFVCGLIVAAMLGVGTSPTGSQSLPRPPQIGDSQERYPAPGNAHASLPPGGRHVFTVGFKGGMHAIITVRWQASARMMLFVRDEYDRDICAAREPSGTGAGHVLTCIWLPPADAVYRASVVNEGPVEAAYTLTTN